MNKVLIVDDHANTRDAVSEILNKKQIETVAVGSVGEAEPLLGTSNFDMVITDLKLPGRSGMDLLRIIREFDPSIPVILITAFATIQTAVEAMRLGAYDYIGKPFSIDELEIKVEKSLANRELTRINRNLQLENEYLRDENRSQFAELVGKSSVMNDIYDLVEKVATSGSSVLITGESGTGKELIARAIHNNSPRKDRPFVKVNGTALVDGLIESELFGHEKGAFTGAIKRKPGRFEIAANGTIFFDEIGDMPMSTQVKLLRVLQEREFERVGGTETLKFDARIVAATNQNLQEAVQAKRFREDLYYRLNVVALELPPLRQRKDDIPLLVHHFIKKICEDIGNQKYDIAESAMQALITYNWPGNIRELENAIERAIVLSKDKMLGLRSFPASITEQPELSPQQYPSESSLLQEKMEQFERNILIQAMEDANNNISHAARSLGLNRTTLRYRLEKQGLIKTP